MRSGFTHRTVEERFDLIRYTPPPEGVRAAQERTRDLLGAFVYSGSRYDDLMTLAVDCYLQGINDAADAIVRTGHKIVRADEH